MNVLLVRTQLNIFTRFVGEDDRNSAQLSLNSKCNVCEAVIVEVDEANAAITAIGGLVKTNNLISVTDITTILEDSFYVCDDNIEVVGELHF